MSEAQRNECRLQRPVSRRPRVVCQFSCGAASAVATKLAIAQYGADHEIVVLNAFIASEHPDNRRFAKDCEKWLGVPGIAELLDDAAPACVMPASRQQ